MNQDAIPNVYLEAPKVTYRLDNAYRIESKTRQFPFVVAHEVAAKVNSGRRSPNENSSLQGSSEKESTDPDAILKKFLFQSSTSLSSSLDGNVQSTKDGRVTRSMLSMKNALLDRDQDDDDETHANREFLVFHDLEHFLTLRHYYPHSHEVVRCPSKLDNEGDFQRKKYHDDLCRGRLIFDFDLKSPLPEMASLLNAATIRQVLSRSDESDMAESVFFPVANETPKDPMLFVPHNFKELMETLIIDVIQKYYVRVDVRKLVFVWQRSPSNEKFSMHLIVKHVYFSEYWVKQMRIFYILLEKMAHEKGLAYLLQTIDFQIPRRNATFRMIGSSKIDGNPLEIVCCNNQGVDLLTQQEHVTIYDCLVGLYSPEHMKSEQSFSMDNIDYSRIEEELQNSGSDEDTPQEKKFRRAIKKQVSLLEENQAELNLDDGDIGRAVEIFSKRDDGTFRIRDQVGDIINLDRCRKGACLLSGNVHDRENAYLKLRPDGHLVFYCRRGCQKGCSFGLDMGVYKLPKTETGGVIVNSQIMEMAKVAKTVVDPSFLLMKGLKVSPEPNQYTNAGNRSKRVAIGTNIVQVPPELIASRPKLLVVGRVK